MHLILLYIDNEFHKKGLSTACVAFEQEDKEVLQRVVDVVLTS